MTAAPDRLPGAARDAVAAVLLAALAFAVFLPALGLPFLNYDDPDYVTANPFVRDGLTAAGARWAFTGVGYAANWHPLTWLSHMLDVSLWGAAPWGHHLTSLLLHSLNAALLFLLLRGLTGVVWPAFTAAALFAVHPLRTEAVAWVSERKELLAACFALLAVLAWLSWARRRRPAHLAAAVLVYAMALLCKPMPVTLPLLLLLLDWWPLGRPARGGWRVLLAEKIPFALLAAGSAAMTLVAQSRGGAVLHAPHHAGLRLAAAATAVAGYVGRTLWPAGLAVFYPYDEHPSGLVVAVAALFAAAATLLAVRLAGRRPWVAAGWLWFAAGLLPVLGLVQVGWQAMADRYTYLPGIGLAVIAAWGSAEAARRLPRWLTVALLAAVLAALGAGARHYLGFWRDSATLFARAAAVTRNNWLAEGNLGAALFASGRTDEARAHLDRALAINPGFAPARINRGALLADEGRATEAAAELEEALRIEPRSPEARFFLGLARFAQGRAAEAEAELRAALALRPWYAGAQVALGGLLVSQGRHVEARPVLEVAAHLDPGEPFVFCHQGTLELAEGRPREAEIAFRRALRLAPQSPAALAGLAEARRRLGTAADSGRRP